MKKWQANLGLLMVAIIWGGSFIATDHLITYFNPINIQTYRNILATIILIVIFFKRFKSANKRTIFVGSILGIIFLLANSLQNQGLVYTTVSKNAFLTANYAIFVPILSIFAFKKLPSKYVMFGLILMLIGYFFIIFDIRIFEIESYLRLKGQLKMNLGDLLTIAGSVFFALHIVTVSYFIKDEDPIQVLIFQSLFAAITGIVIIIFTGSDLQLDQMKNFTSFAPSLIYMTVMSSILCFGGQLVFQQYTDSSSAGILMSLESAFAALFAVLLGIDQFYSGLALGGAIVLMGVITAETNLDFLKNKKISNS